MQNKIVKKHKLDLKNLPQTPYSCMIVPDVDELWDEEGTIASTSMS